MEAGISPAGAPGGESGSFQNQECGDKLQLPAASPTPEYELPLRPKMSQTTVSAASHPTAD